MRIPKNGMLFMIIVIIVMTGIMIIANTNYQYRATLLCSAVRTQQTAVKEVTRPLLSLVEWGVAT